MHGNMGSVQECDTSEVVAHTHEQPVKGWKAIAAVIGVSESWAQRTGRENGIPYVQVGGAVFAYPSRLHAWLQTFGASPSRSAEAVPTRTLRLAAG